MAITIGTGQAKQLLENGTKQAETLVKDPAQVDDLLLRLEEKLKEVPAIGETLSDLPLMISMVKSWINGSYKKVSSKVILCLVGAFLYLFHLRIVTHVHRFVFLPVLVDFFPVAHYIIFYSLRSTIFLGNMLYWQKTV